MQSQPSVFIIVFLVVLLAVGGPLLLWNILVKKMVRPEPSVDVMRLVRDGKRLEAVQLYMKETGAQKEAAIDILQKAEQDVTNEKS
ncbi:MAG: terpene synthase/cyclase family protein [Deltaproteobacteria bacterium]|nr:terpene synthase/cyclase family protein [Deltaproteobacteria bacterium]